MFKIGLQVLLGFTLRLFDILEETIMNFIFIGVGITRRIVFTFRLNFLRRFTHTATKLSNLRIEFQQMIHNLPTNQQKGIIRKTEEKSFGIIRNKEK